MLHLSFALKGIRIERVSINLPRWRGESLRLLLLADLHWRGESYSALYPLIEKEEFDICLLLGDYLEGYRANRVKSFREFLRRLNPPLGKFAVLGNNEREELDLPILKSAGVYVLKDIFQVIHSGSQSIILTGVSEPPKRVSSLLHRLPYGDISVLLSHRPSVLLLPGEWRKVDLVLSGHTHGGQIVLPLLGPLITRSKLGRRYASGLFKFGHLYLYISRGIGTSRLPFRLFCPPEITLLQINGK